MLKTTTLSIALVLAAAFSMPSQGGEPSCGGEPGCCACPSGTCCPQCGCHEGLVPVCHTYWTTKKVTKYCYKCVCEEICLPGPGGCNDGLLGHCSCKCGCGSNCASNCAAGCCAKEACCSCSEGCGCKEGCGCNEGCCHCKYREVHHLIKCPYTEEVCVRKCKVEWVCPHCHCDCGCSCESEVPSTAPAGAPATAPTPPAPPAPPMPPAPPAAGKTTATDLGVPQTSTARPTTGGMAYAY